MMLVGAARCHHDMSKTTTKKTACRSARGASASNKSLVGKGSTRPENEKRKAAKRIYNGLLKLYPDAHCALTHHNAFELLIATILSAQCTDVRVNMVTPGLFAKYPDPKTMSAAPLVSIEAMVRSTGFYRNKAKSLKNASKILAEKYHGQVPDTMDELTALRGVARKTANVVLGNAFGKNEGVVVDTHVGRLSRRLGLTGHTDAKKVEKDLITVFPSKDWTMLAHLLIYHGRAVCVARKPRCDECKLAQLCPRVGVELKS